MMASPDLQRVWLHDLSGMGSSAPCEIDCRNIPMLATMSTGKYVLR